ncbi:ABC transporter permease subunit [Kineococcus sp. T13]|uniref:carbohydrate ABC transporter permease n=1 Tax=Kineococcus vitellinus TaxID=2696565 RepID=UPI00141222DE|nr:sugar ABC transporter permease [Kineococcus vitellinus]NAZ75208.1 ABC transporter permease subunit [Kineococcus vitellinus]
MALTGAVRVTDSRESPAPPRGPRRGDGRAATAFLLPGAIGFVAFTAFPILASLVMSFYDWPVLGAPSFVGLANFAELFTTDPVFKTALLNTAVFVLLYVPVNIMVSMGLAVWISPRIVGRRYYRVLFFVPAVTPMVGNAVVFGLLYTPRGLLDSVSQTLFGVGAPNFLGSSTWALPAVVMMSVWQGFGYNLLVFSAALDAVPPSLTEAAAIDGAGPVRQFFSVVLPLLSPSLFFATVLTLISSFQVFVQPYILTGGGPGNSTTTLVMYLYQSGFQNFRLGFASAIAWVLFVIIMVLTAVQFLGQKKWVHYDQ